MREFIINLAQGKYRHKGELLLSFVLMQPSKDAGPKPGKMQREKRFTHKSAGWAF